MKRIILPIFILAALHVFAQNTHTIDFEAAGTGADWTWFVEENGDNPPLEFIANPVSGGINTSPVVAKFTARQNGNPWALCYTDDDGEFTFDAGNSTVKIMVYKEVISSVHIKFEGLSPPIELAISNTVTNQWEELTFDFSASIGNTYSRIVILPDFEARDEDHIIYFDNIQTPDGELSVLPEPTTVPPVPGHAAQDVISIYTEAYPNIAGTNFNPNWGQSTTVTVNYNAAGNNTLRYQNLNYQGTEFTSQDVSIFEYFHVDFWTPNATTLQFYLISPGAETYVDLPITTEEWVSVDIPLEAYVPPVDLSDVYQFKVVGNGTVYFDNWYFWKEPSGSGDDATLSDLQVDGTTVAGFAPTTLNYEVELPAGTTVVPVVTAVTNDPGASFVVNNATSLPGTTSVVVTSANGNNTLTYNVNFTLQSPEPNIAAPTPTQPEANVLSIYSDAYEDLGGVNFNPFWGQQTIVTLNYPIAGNNTLLYEDLNFQGTELPTLDVAQYDYFHVDFWTSNSTDLRFFLISPGPLEKDYAFDITPETWVSIDIPLEYFDPPVNLTELFQFKVEGNGDIWFDNWYFWKDTGPSGTVTFDPPDGATNVQPDVHPTLTFSIPVEMADGSEITNDNIPALFTLTENNADAQPVSFSGEINTEKTVITIIPDDNLDYAQAYDLTLNDEVIRFQDGNLVAGQTVTFTTIAAPKPYLELDVQDNFENNGYSTINNWQFQDGPDLVDLTITTDPVNPENHVADYDRSGTFLYTNAQFILDHRMDLTERHKFQLRVYFPSSNDYSGALTPTAAIKLQNSLLGPDAYATQTEVIRNVNQFDQWVTLEFDFSAAADSVNYDQVVVQLGGENHLVAAQFYFDDFKLKTAQIGINADFSATPLFGFAPLTVQFTDLSTGPTPSAWEWDFDNDGIIDSYEQNPAYTYENPGTYSVKLKAYNPFFSGEIVKTDLIEVVEFIEPPYIYTDYEANINAVFDGWPVSPETVANPDPSGINTSAVVGKFARPADPYANIFTQTDSTLNFGESHIFAMSVYAPVACEVLLKLESSLDPEQYIQKSAYVTTPGAWETLAWDFPGASSDVYDRIIVFFDFESTTANTFYFDEIRGPEPNGVPLYKPLLATEVQENFENDGYSTIDQWWFEDPDIVPLEVVEDPVNTANHAGGYDRSGIFLYTNARAVLDHRMDLTQRNKFRLSVYFPSSNNYAGALTPTASVKLQNSLLGGNAYTTQAEIVKTVSTFDQWVTFTYDFGAYADREDFDQIIVQLGGENHLEPGMFYFDNFRLLAGSGILADFEASPVGGFAPLTVQFTDLSSGNPTAWTWDFDNDGTIDSQEKNPSFTYVLPGIYSVKLTASNAFLSDEILKTDLIVVAGMPYQQVLDLYAGWSGMSSFVVPENQDIETLFGPYAEDIEIIVGDGGMYFPSQGINTINNWNSQSGYLIKMVNDAAIPLGGFETAGRTISVDAGWSVIPVASTCDVNTADLFGGFDQVVAVKEVAGTGIYWPEKEINTLPVMHPGKAYYILITSTLSFTYPECGNTKINQSFTEH